MCIIIMCVCLSALLTDFQNVSPERNQLFSVHLLVLFLHHQGQGNETVHRDELSLQIRVKSLQQILKQI